MWHGFASAVMLPTLKRRATADQSADCSIRPLLRGDTTKARSQSIDSPQLQDRARPTDLALNGTGVAPELKGRIFQRWVADPLSAVDKIIVTDVFKAVRDVRVIDEVAVVTVSETDYSARQVAVKAACRATPRGGQIDPIHATKDQPKASGIILTYGRSDEQQVGKDTPRLGELRYRPCYR